MGAVIQTSLKPEEKKGFLNGLNKYINLGYQFLGIVAIPMVTYCVAILAWEITDKPTLIGMDVFTFHVGAGMDNIANALMNITVEACLFGCIGLSHQAKKQGDSKEQSKYEKIAWGFAILSIMTVGFKVFHLPDDWAPVLSLLRISSCIIYGLKCHPKGDDEYENETLQQRLEEKINKVSTQVSEHFAHQVSVLSEQFERTFTAKVEQFERTFQEHLQQFSEQKSSDVEQQTELFKKTLEGHITELLHGKAELLRTTLADDFRRKFEQIEQHNTRQIQSIQNQIIEEAPGNGPEIEEAIKLLESGLNEKIEEATKVLSIRVKNTLDEAMRRISRAGSNKAKDQTADATTKKDFILQCLRDHPGIKNVSIIRMAEASNLTISASTVSEVVAEFKKGYITDVEEVHTDNAIMIM